MAVSSRRASNYECSVTRMERKSTNSFAADGMRSRLRRSLFFELPLKIPTSSLVQSFDISNFSLKRADLLVSINRKIG